MTRPEFSEGERLIAGDARLAEKDIELSSGVSSVLRNEASVATNAYRVSNR